MRKSLLSGIALLVLCSAISLVNSWRWYCNGEWNDALKVLRNQIPHGADICLICENGRRIAPSERNLAAAIAWEIIPKRLTISTIPELREDAKVVFIDGMADLYQSYGLKERGYVQIAQSLWSREFELKFFSDESNGGAAKVGVILTFLLVFLIWRLLHGDFHADIWLICLAGAAFLVLSIVSLSVGLNAPNGLAVYGGKAKLLLVNCGLPKDFWTDECWQIFQPAYPPLMTCLAAMHFVFCGCFDEVYIQLVVPFVLMLLAGEFLDGVRGCLLRWLVILFIVSPCTLNMATGFYAEPLAALCLATGYGLIKSSREWRGWMVLGASALVRVECLPIVVLFGLSRCLGRRALRQSVGKMFVAVLPGLCWLFFVAKNGAGIYDFSFARMPNFDNVWCAIKVLAFDVLPGWKNGFYPAVLLLVSVLVGIRMDRNAYKIPVLYMMSVAIGVVALGFYVSEWPQWIAMSNIPRYSWLSAVLPMMELIHLINSQSTGLVLCGCGAED